MSVYYHCAPLPLGAGSIIEPGNWGRVIKLYPGPELNPLPVREALLELSRQIHAPDKPSRLSALFVLPSLTEAETFRQESRRTDLIYEVEPVEPISTNIHIGDWRKVIGAYTGSALEAMLDQSARYWTDVDVAAPEILLPGPVRIMRRLA